MGPEQITKAGFYNISKDRRWGAKSNCKSRVVQDWPVGFVVNFVSQYAGFYKLIAINWVTIEFSAFAI